MIEHGKAIKTYLSLMLKDYATATGDNSWAPLDNRLSDIEQFLPVLIQAQEHYKSSDTEFLKFGEPIPRIKDIVEFYGELIGLMGRTFTHEAAVLLNGIVSGPAVALMRMDTSFRTPKLLEELETLLFDSLLTPVGDVEFDELLSKLTEVFEEIPLPEPGYSVFQIPDEILEQNIERHKAVLNSWFNFLDSYWIARNLRSS